MKLFTKTSNAPKLFTKISNGTKLFSKMAHSNKTPVMQTGNFITSKTNNLEKSIPQTQGDKNHYH